MQFDFMTAAGIWTVMCILLLLHKMDIVIMLGYSSEIQEYYNNLIDIISQSTELGTSEDACAHDISTVQWALYCYRSGLVDRKRDIYTWIDDDDVAVAADIVVDYIVYLGDCLAQQAPVL